MPDSTPTASNRIPIMLRALEIDLRGNLARASRRAHALSLAETVRAEPEAHQHLDQFWLATVARQQKGLHESAAQLEGMKELLDTVTHPPWRVASFLGAAEFGEVPTAMVMHDNSPLIVSLGKDVDSSGLRVGQEVLLNHDRNLLLGASPYEISRSGETAIYDRVCPDGRLVLRWREEEILVRAAHGLDPAALREGDRVLWDSRLRLAYEKIERAQGSSFFLEETPTATFADIGGLDVQLDRIQRSIRLRREHPEVVERYHLAPVRSVLLAGPPGTGKTLIARALANWIAELARSGRVRFMNLKPGSLHSSWYAQSEANYREVFRVAREAGRTEPDVPIVMFFDEIDAIGAARSGAGQPVDDRVLTAFMTELDGLEARGNILVVAATNRPDALDPALLRPGRLGDLVLEIPQPDRGAAVEIFGKHLPADIPYRPSSEPRTDGTEARLLAREELIETAASRIYAPNADTELATLTLRDGTRRTVTARDLVSGAVIAAIAYAAIERACAREVEIGEAGLTSSDLLAAIEAEFATAVGVLTPANARRFIPGLPQDVDVVRVEPIQKRGRRVHRYLRVA